MAIPRPRFNQPPALRPCRVPHRVLNCLPLLNLPLRIRPKSISQEPRPCSINSKPGRLRKMRKHRSGRSSRYKVPKHLACKKPRHCPYQSLDRSKPLGRRTCRHKMPLGLCEASAGTIDLSGTGASPLEQACSSVILE